MWGRAAATASARASHCSHARKGPQCAAAAPARVLLCSRPRSKPTEDTAGPSSSSSAPSQSSRHRSLSSSNDGPPAPPAGPSAKAEEEASTLEEVMASIERQTREDEARRAREDPTPWFSLLHQPSRAAWRSTDHLLGAVRSDRERLTEDRAGDGGLGMGFDGLGRGASALSEAGFNLLQHSGRTNKQLQRTHKRVVKTHKSLALKRERERRLAANLSSQRKQHQQMTEEGGKPDGAIKDGRGRRVGDWRDKNSPPTPAPPPPPESMCDDPSVTLAFSMGIASSNAELRSARRAAKLAKSKEVASNTRGGRGGEAIEKPVGYGPEQALTSVRYRLGPNYSIVRRVLEEVQGLLGGRPESGRRAFRPKRVLDFGCGVGSSGAAALDVFGVSRSAQNSTINGRNNSNGGVEGIDWIHSIDASQPMREATEKMLRSVLEGVPWDSEEHREDYDEESAEFMRIMRQIRGHNPATDAQRLERQRKRLQKWERTWVKQEHRTRLTFGESIVNASSMNSDRGNGINGVGGDDRPPLPWQDKLDEQRKQALHNKAKSVATSHKGTFDLVLCSYTLSEFSDVTSTLAAAALLWEKLAPNGVIVFVEPGTPDGFGLLRSVRTALLECCPPQEIREKRRREREARAATAAAAEAIAEAASIDDEDGEEETIIVDEEGNTIISEEEEEGEDGHDWPEECHVLAPCTHNGTCPMTRHRAGHVKRNTRFGRYEAAAEPQEEGDDGDNDDEAMEEAREEGEDKNHGKQGYMAEWEDMDEDDREQLKVMLGAEGASDEDMEEMLRVADEEEEDGDEDAEEEEEKEKDENDENDEHGDEYRNMDAKEPQIYDRSSNTARSDVFESSFCSFVHNFPGASRRKRGEKFSYLALQKRVVSDRDENVSEGSSTAEARESEGRDMLEEVDVVEMMSRSVYHAHRIKEEDDLQRRAEKILSAQNKGKKGKKVGKNSDEEINGSRHMDCFLETLEQAIEVEDKFLDSTADPLGLELLRGDGRRRGWGRLVRAPLKKKGHVLLDYCSAGFGGGCPDHSCDRDGSPDDADVPFSDSPPSDGTRGRITRQKVSRGWSARSAPGCYGAARKARWGGLWPDLSERVKRAEREDLAGKRTATAENRREGGG